MALRRQADEKLLEVFTWETGRSQFHPGTRIKGTANTLALKRSPASLILEGVRTRMPLAGDRSLPRGARRPAGGARREPLLPLPGSRAVGRGAHAARAARRARSALGALARGGEPLRAHARTRSACSSWCELRASPPPRRRREATLPRRARRRRRPHASGGGRTRCAPSSPRWPSACAARTPSACSTSRAARATKRSARPTRTSRSARIPTAS